MLWAQPARHDDSEWIESMIHECVYETSSGS